MKLYLASAFFDSMNINEGHLTKSSHDVTIRSGDISMDYFSARFSLKSHLVLIVITASSKSIKSPWPLFNGSPVQLAIHFELKGIFFTEALPAVLYSLGD